jgi:hypothetical protein
VNINKIYEIFGGQPNFIAACYQWIVTGVDPRMPNQMGVEMQEAFEYCSPTLLLVYAESRSTFALAAIEDKIAQLHSLIEVGPDSMPVLRFPRQEAE